MAGGNFNLTICPWFFLMISFVPIKLQSSCVYLFFWKRLLRSYLMDRKMIANKGLLVDVSFVAEIEGLQETITARISSPNSASRGESRSVRRAGLHPAIVCHTISRISASSQAHPVLIRIAVGFLTHSRLSTMTKNLSLRNRAILPVSLTREHAKWRDGFSILTALFGFRSIVTTSLYFASYIRASLVHLFRIILAVAFPPLIDVIWPHVISSLHTLSQCAAAAIFCTELEMPIASSPELPPNRQHLPSAII